MAITLSLCHHNAGCCVSLGLQTNKPPVFLTTSSSTVPHEIPRRQRSEMRVELVFCRIGPMHRTVVARTRNGMLVVGEVEQQENDCLALEGTRNYMLDTQALEDVLVFAWVRSIRTAPLQRPNVQGGVRYSWPSSEPTGWYSMERYGTAPPVRAMGNAKGYGTFRE